MSATLAPKPKSLVIAYLLWACGLKGFCGLHRFYLGKPVTGTIWFLTVGVGCIGQFIDLFLIPGMVNRKNEDLQLLLPPDQGFGPLHFGHQVLEKIDRLDVRLQQNLQTFQAKVHPAGPLHQLIEGAEKNNCVLSLAQAMILTGLGPDETEAILRDGMRKGIVDVGNDPETGAVRYYFDV